MTKTRIILAVSCAALVGLLFYLPRAVVVGDKSIAGQDSAVNAGHSMLKTADQARINDLRNSLGAGVTDRNTAIFADSLASLYQAAGRPDSAALWYEQAARVLNDPAILLKAADAYSEASAFATDASKAGDLAARAQQMYEGLLKNDPQNADLTVKLALTYMVTSAPMKGVGLLREVLAKDPEHEQALLNMGMLSLRSGQFAKAVDWLERLTKAHPANLEGQLLLGRALAGTGEKEKARAQYERTGKMTNDPAVQQQLEQLIKELN